MSENKVLIPPLIRVDDLEYLKALQKGQIFMRSSLCYQFGDSSDTARTDLFDGSLPTLDYIRIKLPNGQFAENGKIMLLDCFIKCFIQCHIDDLMITENGFRFSLKQGIKEQMKALDKKYAIIIETLPFTKRFYARCDKEGIRCGVNPVQYLSEKMLIKKSKEYSTAFINASKGIEPKKELLHPIFYKPDKYKDQQEYRLYTRFKSEVNTKIENAGIARKEQLLDIMNETHTITLDEGIEDISTIVPVEDLIDSRIQVTP